MSVKPKVLLLESISGEANELLAAYADIVDAYSGLPENTSEIAAIITRGKGQVTESLIESFPQLRIIARCGVGLDNVDIDAASKHGVMVLNLPGSNADTVAEHTMGLMLTLQRHIFHSIQAVKEGRWEYRNQYWGDEVRGKVLGILGLGNIGSKVARLAYAFGAEIQYWSQTAKTSDFLYKELEHLCASSDILSIHLPLTKETRNLINDERLKMMKRNCLVINTSRAAIVEEAALIDALSNNIIGGYAADVLWEEPPASDHPLVKMDNVLITPHSAGLTSRTYQQMCLLSVGNVINVLSGRTIDERFISNRHLL